LTLICFGESTWFFAEEKFRKVKYPSSKHFIDALKNKHNIIFVAGLQLFLAGSHTSVCPGSLTFGCCAAMNAIALPMTG